MHNGCRWEVLIKTHIFLFALFIAGCSSVQRTDSAAWESQLFNTHPLVGKIWSSADGRFIEQAQLISAASNARYLLLGEKHDNPDHHALQLLIMDSLIAQGKAGAVAFEMLNAETQPRLDAIHVQNFTMLDELKDYLQWDENGWEWLYYGPLLKRSYDAQLPIRAANIDDSTMMQVYSGELDTEVMAALSQNVLEKLNQDIDESHCGLLPESQFPAMVRVQQSRDNQMARALNEGGKLTENGKVSVLIAGNYHIRSDLGVPNYLRSQQSNLTAGDVVTISFSEVEPTTLDPAEYLQQFSPIRAYDFIWFTPAISDEDYCAALRQDQ